MRSISLTLLSALTFTASAFAEDAATSDTKKAARPAPTIDFLFRVEALKNDDGINKDTGLKTPTTDYALAAGQIRFHQDVAEDLKFHLKYDLTENEIDTAYFVHTLAENQSLVIGKQKTKVYGIERTKTRTEEIFQSLYQSSEIAPFNYALQVEYTYKLGDNAFHVAAVEDHFRCAGVGFSKVCTSWNEGEKGHVAPVLAYRGKFSIVEPVVQYASYDKGHSKTFTIGAQVKDSWGSVSFDFVSDDRSNKGLDSDGSYTDQRDKMSGYNLHGEFPVGPVIPVVHVSSFTVKPFTPAGSSTVDTNSTGLFDNNGKTVGIGLLWDLKGEYYRPYFGYETQSGNFAKLEDGSSTTASNKIIKVGVIAKYF